jgi:hypothetical protein
VTPTRPAWFGGAVGLLVGCLLVSGCQGGGGEPPAETTSTRPVRGERADRTMEVPEVDLAGWYEPGPRPGTPDRR